MRPPPPQESELRHMCPPSGGDFCACLFFPSLPQLSPSAGRCAGSAPCPSAEPRTRAPGRANVRTRARASPSRLRERKGRRSGIRARGAHLRLIVPSCRFPAPRQSGGPRARLDARSAAAPLRRERREVLREGCSRPRKHLRPPASVRRSQTGLDACARIPVERSGRSPVYIRFSSIPLQLGDSLCPQVSSCHRLLRESRIFYFFSCREDEFTTLQAFIFFLKYITSLKLTFLRFFYFLIKSQCPTAR